jgi:hypothetical protein
MQPAEAVHLNHLLQIHHLEAVQEEIIKIFRFKQFENHEEIIFIGNIIVLWLHFECANIRV